MVRTCLNKDTQDSLSVPMLKTSCLTLSLAMNSRGCATSILSPHHPIIVDWRASKPASKKATSKKQLRDRFWNSCADQPVSLSVGLTEDDDTDGTGGLNVLQQLL